MQVRRSATGSTRSAGGVMAKPLGEDGVYGVKMG